MCLNHIIVYNVYIVFNKILIKVIRLLYDW